MVKTILDKYNISLNDILVEIKILIKSEDSVPEYISVISNISDTTKIVLEKIREEFISGVDLGSFSISNNEENVKVMEVLKKEISGLIKKYFPKIDERTLKMLMNYVVSQDLGFGDIEILLRDENLEEIVVNNSKEPVWVYHKRHGWLKTNIIISSENKIRHYSTTIGRDVNKEITLLNPLMDAHLKSGDRVNATLSPISSFGNTITIRKFSSDPWTIVDFINTKTISYEAAALIWLAIQNELSTLVIGGTGSGKTSMLNVLSNFFPPNQRLISIEDTRELTLAKNLHWVAMETRLGNAEGKGEVTMLNLLVNSLRMRPDRIIVGEVRKKEEAEIMLEAMNTGHSTYGTFHANTAPDALMRLTNPPIGIPKPMISSIALFLVQNRNRRTGARRTIQIAETDKDGNVNLLQQYDPRTDKLVKKNKPKSFYEKLNLYTGMTEEEIDQDIEKKIKVLKWMVNNNYRDIHQIGHIMSKYYLGKVKV
ncbi:MAG: type II/IV secretion system ATPase subunit [Nanobdellota archaeon]